MMIPQNIFALRAAPPQMTQMLPPGGMPQPQMQPGMPLAPQNPFARNPIFGPMVQRLNTGVRPMMPPAAPPMSSAGIPQPQNSFRSILGMR